MGILQSWRSRLVLFTCLAAVLLPPAMAYGVETLYYWSGHIPFYETRRTSGYAERNYNEVWHQFGGMMHVNYCRTTDPPEPPEGGSSWCPAGAVIDTVNPVQWPGHIGYAQSRCHNWDDILNETCQTTRP